MTTTAFDQSRRPARVTGFNYDALEVETDQCLKDRLAMSEWFQVRFEWILSGRTTRSREIRLAIVQGEIDGISLTAIAKRFGVTRQAAYEQLKGLRNLTRFS